MRRMKEGGPFCCPLSVASRLLRARCIISCTFCVAFVGKDRGTRRAELWAVARKAVRIGIPIGRLNSLAALVHPDVAGPVLDAYWCDNGDEPRFSPSS